MAPQFSNSASSSARSYFCPTSFPIVRKSACSGTAGGFPAAARIGTLLSWGRSLTPLPNMQNGRYEVLETIGSGATSRVDKARDTVIGRTVALKTFLRSMNQGTAYEYFLREAQIVGQLNHPSIVGLYDVGLEEHGATYLVMEYVAGNTLETRLAQGAIPFQKACAWGADLASALARAHSAGIIHGDVKPANILVTEEGKVKLGDFGIARYSTQVSGSGTLKGTPAYLSPEQIHGLEQNARSDLFSLGVVLYEMVTGKRPFDGTSIGAVCAQILHAVPEPPSRQDPGISPALDKIMALCLAKDPANRYASGEDLARELYPLARRTAQPVGRPVPRSWLSRPIPPLSARVVWTAAVLAVVIGALVPAARALRGWFSIPPAPPAIALALAPKAPENLLSYAAQLQIAESQPDPSLAPPEPVRPAKNEPKTARRAASGVKSRSAAAPSTPVAVDLPQVNLSLRAPSEAAAENALTESRRGELEIEILTQTTDGTLAVFADRELLFTQSLRAADHNKPLRLQHALAPGSHQLRVALYRPDKSLQAEKEGLGEIRAAADNKLLIRVARHTKLFLKHDTSLEVIWPAASPASTADAAPAGKAVSRAAAAPSQFPR